MGAKPSSEAAEPDHFVDSGDDISVRDGNFSDAGTEITDPMDLQPHPPAEDDTPTCLAPFVRLTERAARWRSPIFAWISGSHDAGIRPLPSSRVV